jgi:hypothetical protein
LAVVHGRDEGQVAQAVREIQAAYVLGDGVELPPTVYRPVG